MADLFDILLAKNLAGGGGGGGSAIVYTSIVDNGDNTITATDDKGVEHTISYAVGADGKITSVTLDGKTQSVTYDGDVLVKIGNTEVDIEGVPIVETGLLPAEYQEVEYIKADAGQYIDLGFIPNKYNSYRFKCSLTTNSAEVYFGGTVAANNNSASLDLCTYKDNQWGHGIFFIQYYNGDSAKFLQTTETIYDINFNVCGKVFVGTTEYSLYSRYLDYSSSLNLLLFAVNREGVADCGNGTRTLYGAFKVFEKSNNLIHNLVPCYRKSDNVIGLYDTITETFLTNSGTGVFLKGADVNE